jgi:hypothetical protein
MKTTYTVYAQRNDRSPERVIGKTRNYRRACEMAREAVGAVRGFDCRGLYSADNGVDDQLSGSEMAWVE